MQNRFVDLLEKFLNPLGITTNGDILEGKQISSDIFEETLLRLAGITTKPQMCMFNPTEDPTPFIIQGLTSNDITLLAKFLGIERASVSYPRRGMALFHIPYKRLIDEIFPLFQKEIIKYRDTSPEILQPYLYPGLDAVLSKHPIKIMAEPSSESTKASSDCSDANQLLAQIDLLKNTLGEKFTPVMKSIAYSLNFAYSGDSCYAAVAHEPVVDAFDDLLEFCKNNPETAQNEEVKKGLDMLVSLLKSQIESIAPNALNAERPKDANGKRIRFFDRDISTNLLRAHQLASEGKADVDMDDASPVRVDSDDEACLRSSSPKP